jgi:polar amino acid transport system substrate-binding protein
MIARNRARSNIYSAFRLQESAIPMDIRRIGPFFAATAIAIAAAGCASNPFSQDQAPRAALAPTGTLRIAVYPGTPTSLVADAPPAKRAGVGHDLGIALAARLGVPYEVVVYAKNVEALDAVKTGRADFGFTNATAARAKEMDFGPPLFAVEQGYLVPAGSPISDADAVDRPSVRVAVVQGSTSESVLSRELRSATVLRTPTIAAARDMLAAGKADAFATNKAILFEASESLPGSRVLEGRWGLENFAIAIPKGREAGKPLLRAFSEESVANGTVKRAVARAGLRGTVSTTAR